MSDLVDTIHEKVYRLLLRHGLDDGSAGDEASRLCLEIQRAYGGFEHYVSSPDRRNRRAAIREEVAGGKDRREVARKFGVSMSTVSRAVRDDMGEFGGPDWEL